MEDRLAKLKARLNNVNIKNKDEEIVNEIKEKFPEIKTYLFKKSNKVFKGEIIRYVPLELDRISPSCIVRYITYRSINGIQTNMIKNIYVSYENMDGEVYKWRISARKYYIFQAIEKISDTKNYNYFIEQANIYEKQIKK